MFEAKARSTSNEKCSMLPPSYPSSAQHQILLIKYRRLSRRDRALRRVQFHPRPAIFDPSDGCRGSRVIIPNFSRHFDRAFELVEGNPVAAIHDKFVALERGLIAHHDAILPGIKLNHVERFG